MRQRTTSRGVESVRQDERMSAVIVREAGVVIHQPEPGSGQVTHCTHERR